MVADAIGWASKKKSLPWRGYLTATEAADIEKIESELAQIDKRRRVLTSERYRIQNRACQRCRTEQGERA